MEEVNEIDIKDFQYLCRKRKIKWTTHGLRRIQERGISIADVKNCIYFGEIIEEYPEDFPHPSCLIFGHCVDNKVIHSVVGIGEDNIYIITAYYPDTIKFENDLKTRRRH